RRNASATRNLCYLGQIESCVEIDLVCRLLLEKKNVVLIGLGFKTEFLINLCDDEIYPSGFVLFLEKAVGFRKTTYYVVEVTLLLVEVGLCNRQILAVYLVQPFLAEVINGRLTVVEFSVLRVCSDQTNNCFVAGV